MLYIFLFILVSGSAEAHTSSDSEVSKNDPVDIQNDMISGRYDKANSDECSGLYNKNKQKIYSTISYFENLTKSQKFNSEQHTQYAYLLGLKGRCEQDKRSIDLAMNNLEKALTYDRYNEKALGFVAKVIYGFKEEQKSLGWNPKAMLMGRAAQGTFTRFRRKFEVYLAQDSSKRSGNLGSRISSVYNLMIKSQ